MKRMLSQELIDQLSELSSSGGIDWVATLKSKISVNDDGAVSLDDLEITGDMSVNATKIINLETEEALLPLENNAGKVLVVDSDEEGLEATDEPVFKTISQTEANWEIDLKSILNTSFFKDTSSLYAKLCLLGNELELVVSGKFVAKADANTYKTIFSSEIDIPDEIAEKIFRANGTSLKVAPGESSLYFDYITMFRYNKSNPTIGGGDALLQSSTSKYLQLNIYNFGTTSEDDVCYIDVRLQLVVI